MVDATYGDRVQAWAGDLPGAIREFPFGPEAAVFKIGGKMFALVTVDGPPEYVTLKSDPEEGAALRAAYPYIREGYYMNKRHWITVDLGPSVPMDDVRGLLEASYLLVVAGLPRKLRGELGHTPG